MKLKVCSALLIISLFITGMSLNALALDSSQDFIVACENDNLILSYNKVGYIALTDKHTNAVWYSNPMGIDENSEIKGIAAMELRSMLIVDYVDPNGLVSRVNSYVGSVKKENVRISNIKNGIKIFYTFPDKSCDFEIPVEITLQKNYFNAKILTKEIKEKGLSKILSINLLPFFGAGSKKDTGYIFIPDGSGAIIDFNNGKGSSDQYNESVYGREPVLTVGYDRPVKQKIHLPVFGIKNGDKAFLAVIDEGDFSSNIFANVSGSVKSPFYNNVGSSFSYRENDNVTLAEASFSSRDISLLSSDKNDKCNFSERYYPLDADKADYNGMAEKYKNYLINDKNVIKRTTSSKQTLTLELIGGIQKKSSFFGIPINKFIPLTKYQDVIDIIRDLKNSGIDNVAIQYLGWMKNGVNQSIYNDLEFDNRLGGSNGFGKLKSFVNKNNTQLFVDAEFQMMYKDSNGLNRRFDSVKAISGVPAVMYKTRLDLFTKNTSLDNWYLVKPTLLNGIFDDLFKNYKKFGANLSIGNMGNLVYSDFKKNGNIYRDESGKLVVEQIKRINSNIPNILAQDCNAYAFPYVTTITNAPLYSSRFDVADEEIPFYQMAISDLISYTSSPINLSGDSDIAFLKAVQTGSFLMYQLVKADPSLLKNTEFNNIYAAGYKQWIDDAKAKYKKIESSIGNLESRRIVRFENLDKGLSLTQYEDGTKIYVNFNDKNAEYDGVNVTAYDFKVIKMGEIK